MESINEKESKDTKRESLIERGRETISGLVGDNIGSSSILDETVLGIPPSEKLGDDQRSESGKGEKGQT